MTKAELLTAVLKTKGMPENMTKKDLNAIVNSVFENLSKAIKADKRFSYPDFGTFTVRKRKARKGINPRTKEAIKIPASKTVGFKPSPALKKKVK